MITAREQDGQVRTAHALLTVSTTDFCWLIQLHGIANHVQITNAFSVRTQTKQYAITVREQDDPVRTVHVQSTVSTTDLCWLIHLHGIVFHARMINVYNARTPTKIHAIIAREHNEVVLTALALSTDITMHLF